MRNWLRNNPGLVLYLVAPVFGELFSGSAPLNEFVNPFAWAVLTLLYGGGAVIARELVVRWQRGWWSLFALGVAYGVFEEGIVVRSFFDPNWMDLANLAHYGRVGGVNWVWSLHLSLFHALISIAASVAFVEALYPGQRRESWVQRRLWWWGAWLGVAIVAVLGPYLNPYDAPDLHLVLTWGLVIALVGLARVLPPRRERTVQEPRVGPWRFLVVGFLAIFGQFVIVYAGADGGAYPYPVAMVLLVLFAAGVCLLLKWWTSNWSAWDDRHRIALVIGALSFFLIMGPITTNGQYPVMWYSNPVFLFLLWLAYRRVARNYRNAPQAA